MASDAKESPRLQAPSRRPTSNQDHLHPKLATTVRRHLVTPSRKPVAAHNAAAFELLLQELAARPRPLVLDSFCGTGHSTAMLAQRHPQHLVVGIDKSGHRLGKGPDNSSDNSLLLQAECDDLWRLLAEQGIGIDHHYLLYPNPWPKAKHLQRRVHGGAGLFWLLQLGGHIELRSNWQTYVEEFGVAMHLAARHGSVARVIPSPPLSLFERKYLDSGHDLWAFTGPSPLNAPVTKQPI
jgi:tRNA (guanine-N7-)-methyltransferase